MFESGPPIPLPFMEGGWVPAKAGPPMRAPFLVGGRGPGSTHEAHPAPPRCLGWVPVNPWKTRAGLLPAGWSLDLA